MLIDERDVPEGLAATAPDRRGGKKRHQSVLLVGRVCRGNVESACLVHDISGRGLMARFTVAPTEGETLVIEVRGLPAASGTVRWVKGRKAGFQFDSPQPVERVFQLKCDDGKIARPPRFPLYTRATMRLEGDRFQSEALDISAGGIKLASEHPVQPGQTGQVMLNETGTSLYGKVCWAQDGQFGFRFMSPLPLETLAQILAHSA
jgi:hypothetical protein